MQYLDIRQETHSSPSSRAIGFAPRLHVAVNIWSRISNKCNYNVISKRDRQPRRHRPFQTSTLLHAHWRMKLTAAYLTYLQIQIWVIPLALEQPQQRNNQAAVAKYDQDHHKYRIFWQWYVHDPTTVSRWTQDKTTDIFNPSFPEQMDGISTGVHFDVHWFSVRNWSCQKCHTRKYAELINLSCIQVHRSNKQNNSLMINNLIKKATALR